MKGSSWWHSLPQRIKVGIAIGMSAAVLLTVILAATLSSARETAPTGRDLLTSVAAVRSSVWLHPPGLPLLQPCDTSLSADLGCNSWWLRDDYWNIYLQQRATQWPLVLSSLGGNASGTGAAASPSDRGVAIRGAATSGAISVVVYFPLFLADPIHQGVALERLSAVINDVVGAGMVPFLFIGRPEFYGNGSGTETRDVVHDNAARTYMLQTLLAILSSSSTIKDNVPFVSLYWLSAAYFCQNDACTEAQITGLNSAIASTVRNAGFKYLQHVDGPFWEGCWPQPCSSWNVNGYTPSSIAGADALFAESWVQGSLLGGVRTLIQRGIYSATSILLVNDVPNCDLYSSSHPCSTGSLASDTSTWFGWLADAGLKGTWSVWAATDGDLQSATSGNGNFYGDLLTNGTGLTAKGQLHRQYAINGA
jgi:hypothetical protein